MAFLPVLKEMFYAREEQKKEKDYVRNMGKKIEIRTYRAIDRCKEFTGILKAYDNTSVTIADENDKETTFLKTDIALIRQAIDF